MNGIFTFHNIWENICNSSSRITLCNLLLVSLTKALLRIRFSLIHNSLIWSQWLRRSVSSQPLLSNLVQFLKISSKSSLGTKKLWRTISMNGLLCPSKKTILSRNKKSINFSTTSNKWVCIKILTLCTTSVKLWLRSVSKELCLTQKVRRDLLIDLTIDTSKAFWS